MGVSPVAGLGLWEYVPIQASFLFFLFLLLFIGYGNTIYHQRTLRGFIWGTRA